MAELETPYDSPESIMERLTFPSLRQAYLRGARDSAGQYTILRALGFQGERLDTLLFVAADLAKLGIAGDEIFPMIRFWMRAQTLNIDSDDLTRYARQRLEEEKSGDH